MLSQRFRSPVMARDALTGERGAVTLENVIVFTLLITLFGIGLQFILLTHANNVAHAAAQSAVNAARAYNSTAASGIAAGQVWLDAKSSPIEEGHVSVSRTATVVTATVTGISHSFIPGVSTNIRQVVTVPTERWVN